MDTFLRKYIDQTTLSKLPESAITNLTNLEKGLDDKLPGNSTFQDVMGEYGPEISDLVNRISVHVNSWEFSVASVWNSLKFVIDIAKEVYQIVEAVQIKLIPIGASPEVALQKKTDFGVDMVYFVWATIGPLKGRLDWLPFKATLEKWLVRKLALVGIQHAISFFNANPKVATLSNAKTTIMKSTL